MLKQFNKIVRYFSIYGFGRVIFKVLARMRKPVGIPTLGWRTLDIGVIGCGQFAYATIGYFVLRYTRHGFFSCFDTSSIAQSSFATAFSLPYNSETAEDLLLRSEISLVYIASNHASHTTYALSAIERGLDVYIEKPISVDFEQLATLVKAVRSSQGRVFAGYNRPFAKAIADLRSEVCIDRVAGMSMQFFVSGHKIPSDHWYRNEVEGTRICGNVGHWIDLVVHIMSWRGMPDILEITINSASKVEVDDNIAIVMRSDREDIVSIMLSSRCEPFEGINETINFQHGSTICRINDFREMTIWQESKLIRKKYWPKDVGHKEAILQPFKSSSGRDWAEVVASTLLMLHIADMARQGSSISKFSFRESLESLDA